MADDRELVTQLAAIDATPRASWVAALRADLDAAWESGDAPSYLDSVRSTTAALVDQEPKVIASVSGRRGPTLFAIAAIVLVVVGALVVSSVRDDRERQRAAGTPVGNGLIAFVGESDDNPGTSDIHVVAPDGTGLRPLTSTPELTEYAPAWSPDGNRLAFVRTSDEEWSPSNGSWPCRTDCQLVVIDPSTGAETFRVDIDELTGLVPQSLAWSPDGRAIAISSNVRDGWGNVGPGSSRIVDLETGSFTTFTPPSVARWSPDGQWLALFDGSDRGPSLLLVPADRIPTGGDVDVAGLAGVRALPASEDLDWMPDGSALLGTFGDWSSSDGRWIDVSIDIVTVADGERRTLIEDGFDPVVSPDGTQIAYTRGDTPSGDREIWVAGADGGGPQRVTDSLTPPAAWSPDGSLLLASDQQGWFTVRPDGTDRTPLGIRDHSPLFPAPRTVSSGIDWQPARATPPVGNGLIAFVGESDDNPATSDIHVVAPDGTGLRALTSTPELTEYAPAWSPDGNRLAFVRTADEEWSPSNGSWPCRTDCQLVVIDPSTGVETFRVDIDELTGLVPQSLAWSPDGRAIAISSNPRDGVGNIGPRTSRIVDLETGSFTTFTPRSFARWSPDGEWLALFNDTTRRTSLLVPAELIPTGGVVDIFELPGVRRLAEPDDGDWWHTVEWMPDASALVFAFPDRIEVVTVADGERRTLIEGGSDPVVSPDGSQIAYLRGHGIWIAAADGGEPWRVTNSSPPPTWSPDGSLLLASDHRGLFTVRPDGTHRTPLGIRDHTTPFPGGGLLPGSFDWQPAGAPEQ